MSFHRWLQNLRSILASGQHRRRGEFRAAPPRLKLETLEDRRVFAFGLAVDYPVGTGSEAVVTADFNNDGRLDLATANFSSKNVSVLLGNSDGTFQQPALTSATGVGPLSVAVGDFNQDGTLDLATTNAEGNVSVLLGVENADSNGTGTFAPPANIDTISDPQSVAVGDFNGDGLLDLGVTSNVYHPGYQGPGYWGYWGYYPGQWYPGYNEGLASVLLGNGDGSFSTPNVTSLSDGMHVLAVATDLNGDGTDDFLTFNADYNSVNVLLGDTSGFLQYYSNAYTGDYSYSLAARDVNGDAKTDLVTANAGGSVGVLLGDGLGTFSPAGTYATNGSPASVVLGDFTGDGKVDVATANVGGDVSLLRGYGNGAFSPPLISAVGSNPSGVAAGDFNGDGWLDAATANFDGGDISVLLNNRTWPSFRVTALPSSTTAGQAHSLTVTAVDTAGNVLTGYTGTVHFASSDSQAALPADYTFTTGAGGDNGVHTFNLTLKTAGTQSLTIVGVTTPDFTGSQSGIVVNPAAASRFVVDNYPSTSTSADTGYLSLVAYDAYGNVATNYTGTVHFTSSDSLATLPGNYTFTANDSGGAYPFPAILRTVGTQSVSVTDTANPNVTGTQGGVRVIPRAGITGPTYGVKNQSLTFTLTASSMPSGTVFNYALDWNNDGSVDQTVSGPSGTTVQHAYSASGGYNIGVTATLKVGTENYTSYSAIQSVTVLAVSATLQTDPGDATTSALVIEGTASAETLVLSPGAGNGVALSVNGNAVGSIAAPGGAPLGHVLVYGYGGNDTIRLTGGLATPALLFGGDGNDTLDASGSTANNVLVGGAGAEVLTGGSGRDLLIGGAGADTLRGGGGDDILIGGYTDYDANQTALGALMKEWGRTDATTYANRVNHLSGTLSGGLNGSYFLTAKTIHTVYDDAAIDNLFGEAGTDWFFARKTGNRKDKVNDLSTGEVVTAIS